VSRATEKKEHIVEPGSLGLAHLIFSIGAFALAAIANIYVWLATKSKARRAEVDESLDELTNRMTQAERDIQHTPTHHDLGQIHDRLNDTNNALAELTGKLTTLTTSLERVETYLLHYDRSRSG